MKRILVLLMVFVLAACASRPPAIEITPEVVTGTPDPRPIDPHPDKYLLTSQELPTDRLPLGVRYTPPAVTNSGLTEVKNSEVIQARGVKDGQDYLNRTGRITGWQETFVRQGGDYIRNGDGRYVTDEPKPPQTLVLASFAYSTTAGAQVAYDESRTSKNATDWTVFHSSYPLGDDSYIVKRSKPNGSDVEYQIYTRFKNYLLITYGSDTADELRLDFLEETAQTALRKLRQAPPF